MRNFQSPVQYGVHINSRDGECLDQLNVLYLRNHACPLNVLLSKTPAVKSRPAIAVSSLSRSIDNTTIHLASYLSYPLAFSRFVL